MVQTLERAMQIVKLLVSDDSRKSWPISDISGRVGLPLSTTHRLIVTMIDLELVEQVSDTKQYRIGNKWMEIGLRQLEKTELRVVARPVMEVLANEVKESVYLNIPIGIDGILIERIDSPLNVRVTDKLGARGPLNLGAPNKAILAYMEPAKAEAILIKLLENKQQRAAMQTELEEIRRRGYGISYGELTKGTASVAAPLIGFGGKVLGSLGIEIVGERIEPGRLAYLIEHAVKRASEISSRLGG
ncbi:IclR family transcriptional regulator [Cohnella sp.]|uniref:IclR family transcriptional regulator n=1 Tax=Cohnella sp. TaxID=1883426 RepID=UPI0035627A29